MTGTGSLGRACARGSIRDGIRRPKYASCPHFRLKSQNDVFRTLPFERGEEIDELIFWKMIVASCVQIELRVLVACGMLVGDLRKRRKALFGQPLVDHCQASRWMLGAHDVLG